MVEIARIQSRGRLTTTGGVPLTVQQVGSARQGQIAPGTANLIGGAVERAGQRVLRLGELEQRRQDAQDVLDAEEQRQSFRARLQGLAADLSEGDPRTLPDELERQGRDLMNVMAQPLSRGAQERFQVSALSEIVALRGKAEGIRLEQRERQRVALQKTARQDFMEAMGSATEPQERARAEADYQEFLDNLVSTGQLTQAEADLEIRTVKETMMQQTVQNQMRLAPRAASMAFRARIERGETTLAGLPLSQLVDQADTLARQRERDRAMAQNHDDDLLQEEQNRNAATIQSELVALQPTPANTARIRALRNQVIELGFDGLGLSNLTRLSNTLQQMETVSLSPAAQDDPAVERQLAFSILTAQTAEDVETARNDVIDAMPLLKGSTFQRWYTLAEDRLTATNFRNRPSYRQGREFILRAVFPTVGPMVLSTLDPQLQDEVMHALDMYDRELAKIEPQGMDVIDAQVMDIAARVRSRVFFAQELPGAASRMGMPTQLDPFRDDGPRTQEDAWKQIGVIGAENDLTEKQMLQLLKRWQQAIRSFEESQAFDAYRRKQ